MDMRFLKALGRLIGDTAVVCQRGIIIGDVDLMICISIPVVGCGCVEFHSSWMPNIRSLNYVRVSGRTLIFATDDGDIVVNGELAALPKAPTCDWNKCVVDGDVVKDLYAAARVARLNSDDAEEYKRVLVSREGDTQVFGTDRRILHVRKIPLSLPDGPGEGFFIHNEIINALVSLGQDMQGLSIGGPSDCRRVRITTPDVTIFATSWGTAKDFHFSHILTAEPELVIRGDAPLLIKVLSAWRNMFRTYRAYVDLCGGAYSIGLMNGPDVIITGDSGFMLPFAVRFDLDRLLCCLDVSRKPGEWALMDNNSVVRIGDDTFILADKVE